MKRVFFTITTVLTLNCCYAQETTAAPAKEEKQAGEKAMQKTGDKMGMKNAYTATYSSNFKIGNSAYSKMILDMWKDWDDNQLDRHDFMADSIVMMFADGSTLKGKKENMEAGKKYRSSLGSVKSVIHAYVPLRSTDRNEDVVCIWGEEENTLADGKTEKKQIHEVWWFNKDGKITYLRQFTAKFGEL